MRRLASVSDAASESLTSYPDVPIADVAFSRDGQFAPARGTQTRDAVLITNFR